MTYQPPLWVRICADWPVPLGGWLTGRWMSRLSSDEHAKALKWEVRYLNRCHDEGDSVEVRRVGRRGVANFGRISSEQSSAAKD